MFSIQKLDRNTFSKRNIKLVFPSATIPPLFTGDDIVPYSKFEIEISNNYSTVASLRLRRVSGSIVFILFVIKTHIVAKGDR